MSIVHEFGYVIYIAHNYLYNFKKKKKIKLSQNLLAKVSNRNVTTYMYIDCNI